ncbi:N-acetylmuramoyl-L-alanine amidase [Hahella sp. CCB-MM4]|uniref:1,6-anhydro-N-acetylmuramyl-L-alanine amidase AmpD n=1 Tax=Hahella sp. (strain CCB-MM4) TaxID=1926491 RepID=UPI000B9A99EA|nr:1,6-anhydro-N-acetylmuramyl-L-alanine amidase AmpD [Hahella sp. CCB-MM4]OZG72499.1 N-acetylmuramoyl-L-alanine amidase [Hahella sp. CCB-MM4]
MKYVAPKILTVMQDGWLEGARKVPSPNYNQRPVGRNIDMVVVHNISLPPGEFGGPYIEDFFQNQLDASQHSYFRGISSMEVSAHLLIRRDGEIVQFVSFFDRAWHAGKSSWEGSDNCNDFSIGIELEGADDIPYEQVQYQQLACVIRSLEHHFPSITDSRIVGHCDIAPDRKTDPGNAFEWPTLRSMLENDKS